MRRKLTLVAALLAAACVDGGAASRTRTTFDVVIAAAGDPAALKSDHDATIELTAAKLSLGAPEWFEGDALFATRSQTELRDPAQRFIDSALSFDAARAHPGHYTPGDALADLTTIGVVDLLAGPFVAGTAEGLTGEYGTLALPFANHADLGGAAVQLAGIAHLDDGGGDVPFSIALPLDKTIEGVPSIIVVDGGGTVTITVSLEDLVRRIDFTALPRDVAADLMSVEQGRNSVERSVESQATYSVAYAKE